MWSTDKLDGVIFWTGKFIWFFFFFYKARAAFVSRANVTDFYEWLVIKHEIWACEWEPVCSTIMHMYRFYVSFFFSLWFVYGNTNNIIIINNIITIIWRLQLSQPDIKLFEWMNVCDLIFGTKWEKTILYHAEIDEISINFSRKTEFTVKSSI